MRTHLAHLIRPHHAPIGKAITAMITITPPTSSRFTPIWRGGLFSLLLLAAPLLFGADQEFLRTIENEAKQQATTLILNPPLSATPSATPSVTGQDRLEAGLEPAGFERTLRERLPGSYTLYQQLDGQHKQQVYQAYQQDQRLASISEQITKHLSGKP